VIWRTPREPEPIEIELVAIDATASSTRPPPAGAGSLPGAGELVQRAFGRARGAPLPRLGPDQRQINPWPELRVHRLVRLPLPVAERALDVVLGPRADRPTGTDGVDRTGAGAVPTSVLSPLARLHVGRRRRLGAELDGVRVDGALRVHRHGPPTLIEITAEPWSDSATDLSLQVRGRRRPAHLPRRYFDVAHRVMDDLWHQVEAAGAA
jgi:hypothetical protein